MSDNQQAQALWDDERIVEEAGKSPLPTQYHEVVTKAYCIGLVHEVVNDYEAQLATLRTAARALWLALHEREHCPICGGIGTDTILVEPCACSIEARTVLGEWQELAKGANDGK